MKKNQKKDLAFFSLFEKFIRDSKEGRRRQTNGKRIAKGTVANYCYTRKLLEQFCKEKAFGLLLFPEKVLTKRERDVEQNYWNKFYRRFTDYLYDDLGYFDNYVGATIKNIKTFCNYLNRDLSLGVGLFYKHFYVRKEEIAIFPLFPEELNYLIYNKEFERALSKRLQEVKDTFVFGCTVALRVSDLLRLKKTAVRILNGSYYLTARSHKTGVGSLIKLPAYLIDILMKYKRNRKGLLPLFHASNLNAYIKILLEKAGFTQPVTIYRERRGQPVAVKKRKNRFCDVASTHTMRRTAITTMLCLGMPEQLVRKISGHAPASKEFYRYVWWAQAYQDTETEKVFGRLKEKKLSRKSC